MKPHVLVAGTVAAALLIPASSTGVTPVTRAWPQAPQGTQPPRDLPWTPSDTGTVRPGMTREQVVGVWGTPLTERSAGAWTFMYFRNGCEYSCGTHDIVFLENGQVVDAIVRGRGHAYAGISSSPPDRVPTFTPRQPN